MKNVTITASEAESLADYLWCSLIPFIQDKENEVDNLEYVRNLANVWKKCDDTTKVNAKARKGGEDDT